MESYTQRPGTVIDEYITLMLPEGYELRRERDEDGEEKLEVLYGIGTDPDGDETSEISFSLSLSDSRLDEDKRNWPGYYPLCLIVKVHEADILFAHVKFLVVAAAVETEGKTLILMATQKLGKPEDMTEFMDLAAKHLNVLLPCIIVDGKPEEAAPITADDLFRIGGLERPMTEEEAKEEEQRRMAEQYARNGNPPGDGIVSVRAVTRDPVTGAYKRDLFWERMGADSGDPDSMIKLGEAYLNGDGVDRDPVKAVEYYRQAAELDDPVGQYNMGVQCAKGEGTERDFAAAIDWMERAAGNGDEDAPGILKVLEDAPEIERKAYAGDAEAQARFSTLLANFPSEINLKESIEMAERSVARGCPRGYFCLGSRYDFAKGVEKDPVKAAELFRKGAELGDSDCQFSYAACLKRGSGVPQDDEACIEWACKAAEQGHVNAALSLSYETADGTSRPRPIETLIEYLLKAEELEPDNVRIAGQLGVQYINLEPSDFDKAIYWYERAAELGDENAPQMAHVYRYRQKLIDEGKLPEDVDAMEYLDYLHKNDLLAEAFGTGDDGGAEPKFDIDELLERIGEGDPDAIKSYVSACFLEGEGVYDHGIDRERALSLMEELSETDPEAASILGLLYQNGVGVEQNDELAEKWHLKAAESGIMTYALSLAEFYLNIESPFADMERLEKALGWFAKARESEAEAQIYFDLLSYGKARFEEGGLDGDSSILDILAVISQKARDGDEAAEALVEKYSQLFDSAGEN